MIKRVSILLLFASGLNAAVPWSFTAHIPEVADSIVATHYYGTAALTTQRASSTDSMVSTWSLQENNLNQIVYNIWYSGQDSASAWTLVRDMKTSYGATEQWRLFGARWSDQTDSVQYRRYEDGVLVGTVRTRDNTKRSYDTTAFATAGKFNEVRLTLFYPSYSPSTWSWAWDITDTSSGTSIGTGIVPVASVEGYIYLRNGLACQGATVEATAGPAINLAAETGTRYIFIGEPVSTMTDTAGYFRMNLSTTSSYSDTTKGLYTIIGTYGGKEVFKIQDLWVGPSGAVINLADSLAGRTK